MNKSKKYDDNFIFNLFYFVGPHTQRIINYEEIKCKKLQDEQSYINKRMELLFDELTKHKNQQLLNFKNDYKKASYVQKIVSGYTRGVSSYFNEMIPTSRGVSNAFIKSWEVYTLFPFAFKKAKNREIKSFHFAELPGQFINSLSFFLKKNNCKLDWKAESLNPKHSNNIKKYGNTIFSDHYWLYRDYKDRWMFGPTSKNKNTLDNYDTGDILDLKILQYFRKYNTKKHKPLLITSDAGLGSDIMNSEMLQKLEFAQAVACISSSIKGGDVIVKHFGPFDPTKPKTRDSGKQFIGLIYLYFISFHRIYLYKPMSSSNVSSEFYVIGIDLKKEWTDYTFKKYASKISKLKENEEFISLKTIPSLFQGQILKFLEDLNNININGLKKQNYLFLHLNEFNNQISDCLKDIQNELYKTWLNEFMDGKLV